MAYKINIEPQVFEDIQEAILYLNRQQKGLGKKFLITVNTKFKLLTTNPFFEIKYENVRTIQTEPFSYLIHFTVDEQLNMVTVRSVLHTSKDWLK